MVANKPAFALSLAVLIFGIVFFLVAVTGMLWPASKVTDVGVLSTTVICVLFGAIGILASRTPAPEPGTNN